MFFRLAVNFIVAKIMNWFTSILCIYILWACLYQDIQVTGKLIENRKKILHFLINRSSNIIMNVAYKTTWYFETDKKLETRILLCFYLQWETDVVVLDSHHNVWLVAKWVPELSIIDFRFWLELFPRLSLRKKSS